MSKITIVSRDEQALLVDISGCSTFKEAIEQLSTTFLGAGQFWQEQLVDLNLGSLLLTKTQAAQIIALSNGVGAKPNHVFAKNTDTIAALEDLNVEVFKSNPLSGNPTVIREANKETDATIAETLLSTEVEKCTEAKENEKSSAEIKQIIVFEGQEQQKLQQPLSEPIKKPDTSTVLETSQENTLTENVDLKKQHNPKKTTLYLKQTLRAGQAVSHNGDLLIVGDVNAGAEVLAEGDITIWGSLRGIAHAGISGNTKAEIRALRLQPIQIRIANYIARSPDNDGARLPAPSSGYVAETAKLVNGKIRIVHSIVET